MLGVLPSSGSIGGVTSWQVPPRQRGTEAGSHTFTPGQEGAGGHSRLSWYSSWVPAGTAVSEPPLAQPQQSAGTSTQSSSRSHSAAPPESAQASSRQPKSSRAKPVSQVLSVRTCMQTSSQ